MLVRKTETFHNDYRDKQRRIVFHTLKKPIPFMTAKTGKTVQEYVERDDGIETQKYCGIILATVVFACGVLSTIIISRQNRQTR